MTDTKETVLASLVYYDLLDRPLTALEIFKYLQAPGPEISFFGLRESLKNSRLIGQRHGLYFLPGRQAVLKIRQKRLKLSQLKWKKLKAAGRYLPLAPFLRLVAITGSLTAYNSKEASDFDLLIVIKKNRLWLGRLLLTGLISTLGQRRHGEFTRNRLCLNCYLTEENLEIAANAKPRDWHAVQEYGRLTPLLENTGDIYKNFIQANSWLADFLKNYPWSNNQTAKKIKPLIIFIWLRQISERLLGGRVGDGLENLVARWQKERINKKREGEQPGRDQIFVSDHCLMFHPRSKSDRLMKEFNLKMKSPHAINADKNQ